METKENIAENSSAEQEKPKRSTVISIEMRGHVLPNGNEVMLGRDPDGRFAIKFVNNEEDPPRETCLRLSPLAMDALANLYFNLGEL